MTKTMSSALNVAIGHSVKNSAAVKPSDDLVPPPAVPLPFMPQQDDVFFNRSALSLTEEVTLPSMTENQTLPCPIRDSRLRRWHADPGPGSFRKNPVRLRCPFCARSTETRTEKRVRSGWKICARFARGFLCCGKPCCDENKFYKTEHTCRECLSELHVYRPVICC